MLTDLRQANRVRAVSECDTIMLASSFGMELPLATYRKHCAVVDVHYNAALVKRGFREWNTYLMDDDCGSVASGEHHSASYLKTP